MSLSKIYLRRVSQRYFAPDSNLPAYFSYRNWMGLKGN